jgi:hypothetical protein
VLSVAKSYLDGGSANEGGATADHYVVTLHADAKSLTGGTGRSDVPIDMIKRLLCDCSLVTCGRTIPRNGYRAEDFVDDDIGSDIAENIGGNIGGEHDADPSREGSLTTGWQNRFGRAEVREPAAAVYRLRQVARGAHL